MQLLRCWHQYIISVSLSIMLTMTNEDVKCKTFTTLLISDFSSNYNFFFSTWSSGFPQSYS